MCPLWRLVVFCWKNSGWIDGQAQYKKLLESLHGQRSDIGEQESQGVISPKNKMKNQPLKQQSSDPPRYPKFLKQPIIY